MPSFRFHVPEGLGEPGAYFARGMALTSRAAWFVLTIRMSDPEAGVDTFLLGWDRDIVTMIETAPASLDSLTVVSPQRHGRTLRWVTRHIHQVWTAVNLSDGSECIVMVGEDGKQYSGYFMEATDRVERVELIAEAPQAKVKQRLAS